MALNKDILGLALYDVRAIYCNKTIDEIIDEYGSLEAARLHACKAEAEAIIDHFKNNIAISIPGTGLIAPGGGGAVTGASVTGSIT